MYRSLLYTEVLSQNGDFGTSRVDCNFNNLFTLFILLECWENEPDKRPHIQEVVSTLRAMIPPENNSRSQEQFVQLNTMESESNASKPMSNNAAKWIENALKNGEVNSISFDELKNPISLDRGYFGNIMKTTWTRINNYIVYKRLINTTDIKGDILDTFIHELKIHLRLDYSERIVRCLGISQDNLYLSFFIK